jgi:hypothetical protein
MRGTVIRIRIKLASRDPRVFHAARSDEMTGPEGCTGGSSSSRLPDASAPSRTRQAALASNGAFVTGSDLLIDGGVIAAIRAGRIQLCL